MYISCPLILVLYFYICTSLYFYFYQAVLLNNAAFWLSGSIKVCQMNRKNHASRGNERLSKATWNLKHFFSTIFFFFSLSLFSFAEQHLHWQKNLKVSLGGRATIVFCLCCLLDVRHVDCQSGEKCEHSLETECWISLDMFVVWNVFVVELSLKLSHTGECNLKSFFSSPS